MPDDKTRKLLDELHHLRRENQRLSRQQTSGFAPGLDSPAALRQMFDAIYDAVLIHDKDGHVLDCNRKALQMYGLGRDSCVGADILGDLTPGDVDQADVRAIWKEALEGRPQFFPSRARRPADGALIDVEVFVDRLHDGDKELLLSTIHDVSERKRAAAARLETEQRFRATFEHVAVGLVHLSPDLEILRANTRFCQIVDRGVHDILGTSPGALTHPEDREATSRAYAALLSGSDDHFHLEKRYVRPDGGHVWCLVTVTLVTGGRGEPGYFIAVVQDVSGRKQAEADLMGSEIKYRTIFENVSDGISIYERFPGSRERKLIDCNTSYVRASGRSKEELLQVQDIRAFQESGHLEGESRRIQEAIERGERYSGTFSWRRPDGRENLIEYQAVPIRIDDRIFVYGVDRDVTLRRKAQLELERKSRELSFHVENSPLGVIKWDSGFSVLMWSQRAQEIFGWSQEEVLGKAPHEWRLIHDEDAEQVEALLDDLRQGRSRRNTLLNRNYRKDGQVLWCEWYNSAHFDEQGNLSSLLSLVLDVTERQEATAELQRYQGRLEQMVEERTNDLHIALEYAEEARDQINAILKSVADGLIVTDMQHRVMLMNQAAEELLGTPVSQALGMPLGGLLDEKGLKVRFRRNLDRAQARGNYTFDFEVALDDATTRTIEARSSVYRDHKGEQVGGVTILRNVTGEREMDRMKTEFISTAAHELRTPLTTIQGFSELLLTRTDITPRERKEFLGYINSKSKSLSVIINDLLDISRIESGRGFSLNKEPLDLAGMVESKVDAYRQLARDHSFSTHVSLNSAVVWADRDKLDQVLENLFSNAVKYSPAGGIITVRASAQPEKARICISISDQGIGMTPEETAQVFDKFYRADAGNTAIGGTGLGMSIVKYIMQAHEGDVWLESEPGQGTRVHLALPMRQHANSEEEGS